MKFTEQFVLLFDELNMVNLAAKLSCGAANVTRTEWKMLQPVQSLFNCERGYRGKEAEASLLNR